jgi:predicted AlkP superfamily phosphohydrolase/phosphomutase
MVSSKVLVIGLDSGILEFVKNWAAEGYLPNLNKIMSEGTSSILTSTFHPHTMPSWLTSMTGKNPAKLGAYGFLTPKPHSYELEPVKYNTVKEKRVWDIASEHNKKVGLVHIPLTYPPKKVNGFLISDFYTPKDSNIFTYPPELSEELRCLGYRIGIYYDNPEGFYDNIGDYLPDIKDEVFLEDLIDVLERRAKTVRYLMRNYEWDLFMVNYNTLDNLQHWFWRYIDPEHKDFNSKNGEKFRDTIKQFHKRLDIVIGMMIEEINEDTGVIIFSDHGMEAMPKKTFYINLWLESIGMMEIKEKSISAKQQRLSKRTNFDPYCPSGNWRKVKAYSFDSDIIINLRGRQEKGIINPGWEYEKIREYIIRQAKEIIDPDNNKKVVKKAFRKEEIYSGYYIDLAPDVLLEMEKGYICSGKVNYDKLFGLNKVERLSGWHRREGLIIIKPSDKMSIILKEKAQIADITPTILSMLGIPLSPEMDGKALTL